MSESSSASNAQPVPAKRSGKRKQSSSSSKKRRKSAAVSEPEQASEHEEESASEEEQEAQVVKPEPDEDAVSDSEEEQDLGPPSGQQQQPESSPSSSIQHKAKEEEESESDEASSPDINNHNNAAPSPAVKQQQQQRLSMSPTKARQPSEKPQGPVPRLTIHKIVLINFKSYAGVVNIGPFHPSFSAIVGPNGSGKSNTIDALLFVFGFKASKMRQAKLSELIHNSDAYLDLDYCSVEVHFREIIDLDTPVPQGQPPLFDVVPGSELVVARTAYKNNTSKYTVNSRTSNFKDVTALLKKQGIDLDHKRFLILQGEVESIALMKPKGATEHEDGLLEYLEDIIGTDRFKEPLDQANKEVEEYNDQRSHAMNRVKVVEHEKAMLEVRFANTFGCWFLLDALTFIAAPEERSRRLPPRPEPALHRPLQGLPVESPSRRRQHGRRPASSRAC